MYLNCNKNRETKLEKSKTTPLYKQLVYFHHNLTVRTYLIFKLKISIYIVLLAAYIKPNSINLTLVLN